MQLQLHLRKMFEMIGVGKMMKYEEPMLDVLCWDGLGDVVTLSTQNDIDINNEQGEDGSWLL